MACTNKSTFEEIKAEAAKISDVRRAAANSQNSRKILKLRESTGLDYAWSVTKAQFRLEIIDRSGKGVKVIPVSEFMPFYQFNEFLAYYRA